MFQQILMPKIIVPILIVIGFLTMNIKAQSNFADPQQVKTLVQEGAMLIDVRSTQEFRNGHLPGAVNIPINEINQRLKEIGKPQTKIIVYCRSGNRSSRAKALLDKKGFTEVYNLGGIGRWPK